MARSDLLVARAQQGHLVLPARTEPPDRQVSPGLPGPPGNQESLARPDLPANLDPLGLLANPAQQGRRGQPVPQGLLR